MCNVRACLTLEKREIVTDRTAADGRSVVVNGCGLSWWLGVNLLAQTAHDALRPLLLLTRKAGAFFWEEMLIT